MYVCVCVCVCVCIGLPQWLRGKESTCSAGDTNLNPGSGRSPEEEMATYSSILAQEIPWTEKPGGLQFMGSKRVIHNLATKQQQQIVLGCYS